MLKVNCLVEHMFKWAASSALFQLITTQKNHNPDYNPEDNEAEQKKFCFGLALYMHNIINILKINLHKQQSSSQQIRFQKLILHFVFMEINRNARATPTQLCVLSFHMC